MFLETVNPTPKPTLLVETEADIVKQTEQCFDSDALFIFRIVGLQIAYLELPLHSRTKYFDMEKLPLMVALPKLNHFTINLFFYVSVGATCCNLLFAGADQSLSVFSSRHSG